MEIISATNQKTRAMLKGKYGLKLDNLILTLINITVNCIITINITIIHMFHDVQHIS